MTDATTFATDWSNHNTGALTAAQAQGLTAFYHKCTDGNRWFADGFYKSHTDMARSLGIPVLGSYHVLWGGQPLDQQADWYVQQAKAGAPDGLVFMSDNEPFGYNGPAPTIDQINAFNQMVCDRAGVPAGSVFAYCPQWVYGSAVSGLRFPWIQSNYGSNPTGPYADVYRNTVGNGSSRWNGPAPMFMLQYGSRTDVGDANAFRGDPAAFLQAIGVDPAMTTADNTWAFLEDGSRPVSSDKWTPPEASGLPETGYLQTTNNYAGTLWGTMAQDAARARMRTQQILGELDDVKAQLAAILDHLQNGGSGTPEPTPPAASYTVSLSGSVDGKTGAISVSGSARPIPPASGQ